MRIKPIVKSLCLPLLLLSLDSFHSNAQSGNGNLATDSLYSGIWKGESICQIKNSPCHDENVVYYISKLKKDHIIEIKANKIVNGIEEEMGIIQFRYDAKSEEIISISQPNSIWKFKIKQNSMEGTLYSNNALFRIISLRRA